MSIFVNITDLAPGQAYAFKFRSYNGDGYSDWSQIFRHRTTGDLVAPEAITGLEWDVVGGTFVGKWNKVIYDAQGKRLDDFKDYQIQVTNGTVTKTYYQLSESFTFGTDLNKQEFGAIMTTLTITVAARDYTGNIGVAASKTATDPVPPTPSTPVTSTNMGQVVLAWDGKTNVGGDMPYNFSYVEVHASTVDNFTPSASTLNQKQTGKFQIAIDALSYDTPYYFKLVAINELNRQSLPSGQATGTPARISGLDIKNGTISVDQINFASQLGGSFRTWFEDHFPTSAEGAADGNILFRTDQGNHQYVRISGSWVDAQDTSIAAASQQATQAVTAANGKNKNVYSTSDASGTTGYIAGDQWFKRDAGGVIIAQWEFTTSWQPRTVSGVVISSIDAGKITTGTLDAARIAANSITADRLTVAALSSTLSNNGQFTDVDDTAFPVNWTKDVGTGFVGATYSATTTAANVASGTRAVMLTNTANNGARLYATPMIPAAAAESISVNAWLKGAAAYTGNSVSLSVMCYDAAGAFLSSVDAYIGPVTATYAQYGGQAVLPANTKQIRFSVVLISNAAVRSLYVSDLSAYRPVGVTMIADGAVTSSKINAGAVTANSIGTNTIITASANIGTAVIDSTNIGSVNAGTVTLGTMKSSQTASYGGVAQPVWSVSMAGAAIFAEMTVVGQLVVGSSNTGLVTNNAGVSVRSYNYLAGSAGWAIKGDGSAEFNNGTFRGTIASATMTSGTISGTSITSTSTITGSTITGAAISGGTITGGTIQTSSGAYPRVTMDTTGINLYNAAGTIVTSLSASTGLATITGLYRSNFSGQRVEINSSWTRPEGAAPYASYAAVRIFGSDGFYGEISNGDSANTGVYTLQMISPKATATNGSYLRLKSDDTFDMTGKTGSVSATSGLNLIGNVLDGSGGILMQGTTAQINASTGAFSSTSAGKQLFQVNSGIGDVVENAYNYGVAGYGSVIIGMLHRFTGTPGIGFLRGNDGLRINSVNGVLAVRTFDDVIPADISAGNLFLSGQVYPGSDASLKSNIAPISTKSMLDEIIDTPVYEYDMESGPHGEMRRSRGIIASEASDVVRLDASEEIPGDHARIDLYGLTATNTGAIQALNRKINSAYAIIEELRQEIQLLKGNP